MKILILSLFLIISTNINATNPLSLKFWLGVNIYKEKMFKPLPRFNEKTLKGHLISNKDLHNKITVLNVFATWCGPCIREHEILIKMKKDNPNLQLIGIVARSNLNMVKSYLKKYGNPYDHIILNYDQKLVNELVIEGVPITYITAYNGTLQFLRRGMFTWNSYEYEYKPRIKKAINVKPPYTYDEKGKLNY